MTPPCSRCDFDIDTAPFVRSTQPMLQVQRGKGTPRYWVCGHCHAPGEQITKVVKYRTAIAAP